MDLGHLHTHSPIHSFTPTSPAETLLHKQPSPSLVSFFLLQQPFLLLMPHLLLLLLSPSFYCPSTSSSLPPY